MKEFSEKLRELREEEGLSPEELSRKLEKLNMYISPNSIRNYENGIFPKDVSVYNKLAKFFEVTPNYLFDETIENKSYENIEISKILNLSDKSIEILKEIDNNGINHFIENINMHTFSFHINNFFNINKILSKDMTVISGLLLKKYYTTYNLEFLKQYIKKSNNAFKNIIDYIEDSQYILILNSSDFTNFKNDYEELKKLIIDSKKISNKKLEEILSNFILSYGNLDTALLEIREMEEYQIMKKINILLATKSHKSMEYINENSDIEELMSKEYKDYNQKKGY